jgi:hypothetical protein
MQCQNLYLGPTAKICQHVQGEMPALTWRLPKTFTFNTQPNVGDTVIINGIPILFVPLGAIGLQVNIGATVAATAAALRLLLRDSLLPEIAAATYAVSGADLIVTPKAPVYGGTPFLIDAVAGGRISVTTPHATPNFIFTKELISDQLGFGDDSWGKRNMVSHVADSGRRQVVLNYSINEDDWHCLGSVDRPLSYFAYVVTPVAELLQNLVGNSYMMAVHDVPQSDANAFAPVVTGLAEAERVSGKLMIYGIKVEVD